jgi:hypothetical protein
MLCVALNQRYKGFRVSFRCRYQKSDNKGIVSHRVNHYKTSSAFLQTTQPEVKPTSCARPMVAHVQFAAPTAGLIPSFAPMAAMSHFS